MFKRHCSYYFGEHNTMIPSSSSRNFSRPFPSPLSASALDTFSAGYRERHVSAELPHSASQINMPYRPSPRPSPASRLAYRFVEATKGGSPVRNGGSAHSPSPSPLRHHARKNSKTSVTSTINSAQLDLELVISLQNSFLLLKLP